MELPASVAITEVGPRDGLQSAGDAISTASKIQLVDALARTGLRRIEVTSFVHPKLVPSMADAEQVMGGITRMPGVTYTALVPNARGAERAVQAGADELNVVVSTTETFNHRNLNMRVTESAEAYRSIAAIARAAGTRATIGLSVCFGCPYEGVVPLERLLHVLELLVEAGAEEIALADTIGVANPRQVQEIVRAVQQHWPQLELGLHFHDTRGLGMANVLAGLEAGVARFDASVGGIGACPFAPGATGNVCTEDAVHMLELMGVQTDINLDALTACGALVQQLVGHEVPSRMVRAGSVHGLLARLSDRAAQAPLTPW
ncbi:MAG: hydroxymethylglutaryl-CoA lyase [Chloroflexota bacterium]|jgi:hydroxymethylglutaryl-CoA lyase|nr:hydroxymethylglutaryl-CoA lyase [Chloroflexota bacterium]